MKVGLNTNISNNKTYNPNFSAILNIKANTSLLDAEAIKELQEISKKIGDKNTKIDMYVKYDEKNPYVYKVGQKTELGFSEKWKNEKISFETEEKIVKPTITPLNYAKGMLSRINKFINLTTSMQ